MLRHGAPDVLLTKLVILRWAEGLMRYAPLIEDEVFDEIRRFDGSAVASDFIFVWKFAIHSDQASDVVHEAQSNSALLPATNVADKTAPASTVKFDLPKSALDDDDHDHGFAATMIDDR